MFSFNIAQKGNFGFFLRGIFLEPAWGCVNNALTALGYSRILERILWDILIGLNFESKKIEFSFFKPFVNFTSLSILLAWFYTEYCCFRLFQVITVFWYIKQLKNVILMQIYVVYQLEKMNTVGQWYTTAVLRKWMSELTSWFIFSHFAHCILRLNWNSRIVDWIYLFLKDHPCSREIIAQ